MDTRTMSDETEGAKEKDMSEQPLRHVWILDESGHRDDFIMESGYHNGPGCSVCGESFCQHCEKDLDSLVCEGPTPPTDMIEWARSEIIRLQAYVAKLERQAAEEAQS